MIKCPPRFLSLLACVAALLPGLVARDVTPAVSYFPQTENVEGDQPLLYSYTLEITSPGNVLPGQTVSITPVLSVIYAPEGVSHEAALSHVSLNPATLDFTGPNQRLTTVVTSDYPLGTVAGSYAFAIATPGWPAGTVDTFGFINAKIYPKRGVDLPTVTITTPEENEIFTWVAGTPGALIPVTFTATSDDDSPITSIDADVDGNTVTITSVTGLNSAAVTAQGHVLMNSTGLFTLTARATNEAGTSSDFLDFLVEQAGAPPTVAIASPLPSSTYTLGSGGTVNVPYAFSALSPLGALTSFNATLNGNPVSFSPLGLPGLAATGAGTFSLSQPGTYVLVVTASNVHGTSSTSTSFTVNAVVAQPDITINCPTPKTVITRKAGTAASCVSVSFSAKAPGGHRLTSMKATLNGQPVALSSSYSWTYTSATSGGYIYVSTPGTYTLTFTTTASNGASAAKTVSFTVVETAPPPPPVCKSKWLPPFSQGKPHKGGKTLPLKFTLEDGKVCNIRDTSVVISVCEIDAKGNRSAPVLYRYDRCSPNAPTYTINGNGQYHLNLPTLKGKRRYQVELYRFVSGSSKPQLVGSRQFETQ